MPSSGCDILLEDGSGGLLLENGDDLLLEDCVPVVVTGGGRERLRNAIRVQLPPQPEPVTLSVSAVVAAPLVTGVADVNDDEVVMELLAGIL